MDVQAIPIVPRIDAGTQQETDVRIREPMRTRASFTSGEVAHENPNLWSIHNEYFLIGIMIILVTVILFLIAYIVRIRQHTVTHEKCPSPGQPPGQPQTDGRTICESGSRARIPRPAQVNDEMRALAERAIPPSNRASDLTSNVAQEGVTVEMIPPHVEDEADDQAPQPEIAEPEEAQCEEPADGTFSTTRDAAQTCDVAQTRDEAHEMLAPNVARRRGRAKTSK
jgi:hypothetical protein